MAQVGEDDDMVYAKNTKKWVVFKMGFLESVGLLMRMGCAVHQR